MSEIAALQPAPTDKESNDTMSVQIKTSLTFTAVLKLMNDLELKVGPTCMFNVSTFAGFDTQLYFKSEFGGLL